MTDEGTWRSEFLTQPLYTLFSAKGNRDNLNHLSYRFQRNFILFFKKYFMYLFLDRGEGREGERE